MGDGLVMKVDARWGRKGGIRPISSGCGGDVVNQILNM